jgi:hypothetical protein
MASEHPKITAYIPQDLLDALDAWKETHNHNSRNSAVVAILRDYLGVTHSITHSITHEGTFPHNFDVSAVLETLETLTQRLDAVEAVLSALSNNVPDDVLDDEPDNEPDNEPDDEPDVDYPLTQRELAERLGMTTQNVSNHRRQSTPKDKTYFEAWSKKHDPDDVAWTWIGRAGGKGIPMQYVPVQRKS